jgi:hypothetical protein
VHGTSQKIRTQTEAVHWILSFVQQLIQSDAAFGLLHPTGLVH